MIGEYILGKQDMVMIEEYVDDGYSGVNFERPGFMKMMEDIKSKKVNCVICKDLSRFARNYIDSGRYLEKIFPFMGVRFIAINDNYDSFGERSQSDSLIIPFKNLINDAYILMLVKKYHDTHCEDKEVLITINKAIDASPELRSKKQLIETFISGVNDVDDVMNEWHDYVVKQREDDLEKIITEEKLKPNDTRKFLENAFRDGEIKTAGTDIDKLMPPVSRFGGGGRAKKKQGVIDKLKAFFEKYFGIGGSATFTKQEEHKATIYELNPQESLSMVAEPKTPYGADEDSNK